MKGDKLRCLTWEFKDGCSQRICMASLIFNCVKAGSRILKQSSEQRERHFSELLKRLSEARCSPMRVAKCLLVSPI